MISADDESRFLCHQCIGEQFLSEQVELYGKGTECSYCGSVASSIAISDLADMVETAFLTHYERTSNSPQPYEYALMADREISYSWERDGDETRDAIEYAAAIPDSAADDILEILSDRHYDHEAAQMQEEYEFDPGARYQEKLHSATEWHAAWAELERSLRVESRFFNRGVLKQLESIFEGIEKMVTSDGGSIFVEVGPGTQTTSIHRARVFQSDESLKEALIQPELHLGPPPSRFAMAGRMNAQGVSVFYGATDEGVALSEVRPPVGSKVLMGEFSIVQQLRLLDLRKLRKVRIQGSIFDPGFKRRLEQGIFLERLSAMITRPVMPDDQLIQYLPTQAIADYLANSDLNLDGIVFPSAQSGHQGANVVLFHSASQVVLADEVPGLEATAYVENHTDEGVEPDFTVIEQIKPIPAGPTLPKHLFLLTPEEELPETTIRVPSLKLNRDSLTVREISAVEIRATTFSVTRHRFEGRSDF